MQIEPHGGILINRMAPEKEREDWIAKAKTLKTIRLSAREISDMEMIATGASSPLEGFMKQADYIRVVNEMHLANGLPWSLPIVLAVAAAEAEKYRVGEDVSLLDENQTCLGVLHLEEKYSHDKQHEAEEVYGTDSMDHPGVAYLHKMGDILLGGKITVLHKPVHDDFKSYRLDPSDTRKLFHQKGWKTVVGFQTRNPIHRAHEYIQKCALEIVDGLLIHPLVGETKGDDISASIRMKCYEALMANYYPKDRTTLAVFPAAMRYAGPREAIFHAIIRKNYGCTHFIVGRDHAGVGNFYDSFEAHAIFDEFKPGELGITPLFFNHTFYCRKCGSMASYKTCPHDAENYVFLSGTKVREMLRAGVMPPEEFSRPEVAKILIEAMAEKTSDKISDKAANKANQPNPIAQKSSVSGAKAG
jgi:sulfate adenylyltransferase